MPKFKYTVKDKRSKTLKGIIESASKEAAIQSLRGKEFIIVLLEEDKGSVFSLPAFKGFGAKRAKMDDLVIFSRQLATQLVYLIAQVR